MTGDVGARERILRAAAELLAESGGAHVSTRAVCAAAGVGAPTLYHYFGDRDGLFEAVVEHGMAEYLAAKGAAPSTGDPVGDLRRGWDSHVGFGLANPAFYALIYGSTRPGRRPGATAEAYRMLLDLVEAVARAGRLTVPAETAAAMIHAASAGVTLHLIAGGGEQLDLDMAARTREAVLAAVTTTGAGPGEVSSLAAQAIALEAGLGSAEAGRLTAAEAAMLREWLRRLAA
ncbi:TetR/AcrR family transcriptional regulator [Longispora albida]|uniref:TetR/AcrR family transcriptional regulator n=1 Tax=Longispora albida TaxID=203523 RepID=UPI00039C1924|nr:TetR/AcrR family transcriptional regulator [Longispora albida]